ncbi:hypothetical protein [Chryseobacterium turcicum]|uniref:Uncharacterized protein n=1 Tax=Chryseobacterium turcicum TaxID=2898076 RepID=A0A9Q3UZG3_9FLAO|nr:hypothetical protein [Chryseobacterium turcicum]MCD1116748.1 hypothetical protein [Chryseobacterium turcicum]
MEKKVLSDLEKNLNKSKGLPIDSIKIDITSDNIPDYLIFDEMDNNSPVLIFDGKTGVEIKNNNKFTSQDFSVEELNIDCKNPRKALRLISNRKVGLELSILQYNSTTNSMDLVFNYPILILEFDNNVEKIKDANYIDLIYSDKKCFDTIKISKGKFLNYEGEAPIVKPLSQEKIELFIYNINKNKFEKIAF